MTEQAAGGRPFVVRCAWCDRVCDPFGVWGTLPLAEALRLEAADRLTHGLCPDCFARVAPEGARYPEPA